MFQTQNPIHPLQQVFGLRFGFAKLALADQRHHQIALAIERDAIFRSESLLFESDNLTALGLGFGVFAGLIDTRVPYEKSNYWAAPTLPECVSRSFSTV